MQASPVKFDTDNFQRKLINGLEMNLYGQKIHVDTTTDRSFDLCTNPCLYTDINGKEWVFLFTPNLSFLYDIENNESFPFLVNHSNYLRQHFGIEHDPVKHQCITIDNNKHIMYWLDGNGTIGSGFMSLISLNIKDIFSVQFLFQKMLPLDIGGQYNSSYYNSSFYADLE